MQSQRCSALEKVRKTNIGIVGGGIGGVAAAVALRQVGIDAVIYERAAQLREVGAGMMLWPNATRVLRGMGLLEKVRERSGSSTRFLVRASSGTVLMNIALGEFDVPAICIRRSDLLDVILAELPPECIQLGHKLDHLDQSEGKVRISFAGGMVKEHDAVIGADGIRSCVRSQLFGPSDPIYRGYVVWRGVAQYNGGNVLPGTNSETWGVGKRFGIIDTGQGKFTWYATANVPPEHLEALCGRKRELQQAFLSWHEPISDLIEATDEEMIMKNGAYDRAPLARWGEGRVTLLGDAAHACTPNLGQGGCMALEDAAVLAKCVELESSVELALRRYESLRRHRTRHIQKRSRLMGEIGQWENRIVIAGRRLVTSLLPARPFERNLRRVYSYEI
jgi:2-polyprenyl-6-methoxyphenol hydroxylase-like FAD-dependent oxidoreductase